MAFDKFVSISTVQTMHIWVNRRDVDSSCFNYPNSNKTVCVCVCVTRRSRANVVAIIKIAVVSLQTLSISQIRVVVVNKHTISMILQFYLSTGCIFIWCGVLSPLLLSYEVLIDDAPLINAVHFIVYHFCCHSRVFSPLVYYIKMLFCIRFSPPFFFTGFLSILSIFSIKKKRRRKQIRWMNCMDENVLIFTTTSTATLYSNILLSYFIFRDSCHNRMYAHISVAVTALSVYCGQYLN